MEGALTILKPSMVVHHLGGEPDISLSLRPGWSIELVPEQSELFRETLS